MDDSNEMTLAFVRIMFDELHNDDGIKAITYSTHRSFLKEFCVCGEEIFEYVNK